MENFLRGEVQIATAENLKAPWLGAPNGKYFKCSLCGYKFQLGDPWRCIYTNDIPGAGGNPLVCKDCYKSKEDVVQKWTQMIKESETKYWYFTRSLN